MPIIIGLNSAGAARHAQIKKEILTRPDVIKHLKDLPHGVPLELTYDRLGRFPAARNLTTGMDAELQRLGVVSITRIGKDNKAFFSAGAPETIDSITTLVRELAALSPEQRPRAEIHEVSPLYYPGIPADNIAAISAKANMNVISMATGQGAARGVAATGNLGAVSLMQFFGRVFKASISVLNGGLGTRLFGLRKLKGDIEFGFNNLTVWNLLTAELFRRQMPKTKKFGDYHVMLANDGVLIPFGHLMAADAGKVLKETTEEEAREGYIFICPDDPAEMDERDTHRFGMVALRSDGSFICATEKEGRDATLKKALQRLADQGVQARDEEVRLYINYFGMATTEKLEHDLRTALMSSVKPGITADEVADLDTYSLLFAALSSPDPADFRAMIAKQGLNRLFVEPDIDFVVYPRLRKAVMQSDGKTPRFGFAEFGRGAVALDIGTVEALHSFYLDLVKTYNPSGDARDKLLGYLKTLQRQGHLEQPDQQLLAELEIVIKNNTLVARATAQRIAGFNPDLPIENCEFEPVLDERRAPILGAPTDAFTTPASLQDHSSSVSGAIQDIIRHSVGGNKLEEYRDPKTKRLLFRYDPEGIKTMKLADCRVRPGAVIGRDFVGLGSEIGNGVDTVVVAAGGAVVASRIEASVTHQPAAIPSEQELTDKLKTLAQARRGTVRIPLQDGWTAVIEYNGTLQDKDVAGQFVEIAERASKKEQRKVPESTARLSRLLGTLPTDELIILNLNDGINRLAFSQADQRTAGASDPAKVHYFAVSFERVAQPKFIVYGREQHTPIVVTTDTAYSSKQPTANAAVKDYEIPFTADPAKTILPGLGYTMKDPRMQEDHGYFTRFELRTDQEIRQMSGQMAAEVELYFQQLPAVASMPEGTASIPVTELDKPGLQQAIERAIDGGNDIRDAIINELVRQTPAILASYLSKAGIGNIAQIQTTIAALQQTTRGSRNKAPLERFFTSLNITNERLRQATWEIINGYPLSQLIFAEHGATRNAFRFVIEGLIEKFRMKEAPLFAHPDPENSISLSVADNNPIMPTSADNFDLDRK
jgi:hypothetical protein